MEKQIIVMESDCSGQHPVLVLDMHETSWLIAALADMLLNGKIPSNDYMESERLSLTLVEV